MSPEPEHRPTTPAAPGADPDAVTEVGAPLAPRPAAGRVFIKLDMEGVSGVVSRDQVRPDSPEYPAARAMLMHDLQAVLEGAFSAGCQGAVVYDMHMDGRNVDVTGLDSRATLVAGCPGRQDAFSFGPDDSFAALFLVGAHARAGASEALMPHTYDDDIVSLRVNGRELGEIGLEAALAGEFGIPLALVTGDSGAVRETTELLGTEPEVVEVKKALSATSAVCLPATRTARMLRTAAAQAVRRAPGLAPLVFQSPAELEVEFAADAAAEALAGREGIERTGECSVRACGRTVASAFRRFVLARSAGPG